MNLGLVMDIAGYAACGGELEGRVDFGEPTAI